MIEKMMWVSPKTQIQQFAANDRVSACLNLRCMLPTAENDSGAYGAGQKIPYINGNGGSYDSLAWRQWVYNETDTGRLHREHECGAGAGINPVTMAEYNNPDAKITDVWLDGYGVVDNKVVKVDDGDRKFTSSENISILTLLNSQISSLTNVFAKWLTDFNGTVYTHVGWASWDSESGNFS